MQHKRETFDISPFCDSITMKVGNSFFWYFFFTFCFICVMLSLGSFNWFLISSSVFPTHLVDSSECTLSGEFAVFGNVHFMYCNLYCWNFYYNKKNIYSFLVFRPPDCSNGNLFTHRLEPNKWYHPGSGLTLEKQQLSVSFTLLKTSRSEFLLWVQFIVLAKVEVFIHQRETVMHAEI